ncbi:MAG: hypothetical protein U0793_17495 [Gemmataceae bacterium]
MLPIPAGIDSLVNYGETLEVFFMPDTPDPRLWKFDATPEEIQAEYDRAKQEPIEDDLKNLFTAEEGPTFDELIEQLKAIPNGKAEPRG